MLKIQYARNEHLVKENTPDIHDKVACVRSRSNNTIAGQFCTQASGGTRVPVVKTADLRDDNNVAFRRRFGAPRCRRIAVQRQMRPGIVIVVYLLNWGTHYILWFCFRRPRA